MEARGLFRTFGCAPSVFRLESVLLEMLCSSSSSSSSSSGSHPSIHCHCPVLLDLFPRPTVFLAALHMRFTISAGGPGRRFRRQRLCRIPGTRILRSRTLGNFHSAGPQASSFSVLHSSDLLGYLVQLPSLNHATLRNPRSPNPMPSLGPLLREFKRHLFFSSALWKSRSPFWF